jgi:hypothetical protein
VRVVPPRSMQKSLGIEGLPACQPIAAFSQSFCSEKISQLILRCFARKLGAAVSHVLFLRFFLFVARDGG